ncbi:hypothetical protein [Labrys okinawensis]|uniref:hypothetical protein n=1 Tax=Labrys okinawensis TaxID=346911 RepID=UPI0011B1E417|nr:hypothetical protein [Labrys okinawensis]
MKGQRANSAAMHAALVCRSPSASSSAIGIVFKNADLEIGTSWSLPTEMLHRSISVDKLLFDAYMAAVWFSRTVPLSACAGGSYEGFWTVCPGTSSFLSFRVLPDMALPRCGIRWDRRAERFDNLFLRQTKLPIAQDVAEIRNVHDWLRQIPYALVYDATGSTARFPRACRAANANSE